MLKKIFIPKSEAVEGSAQHTKTKPGFQPERGGGEGKGGGFGVKWYYKFSFGHVTTVEAQKSLFEFVWWGSSVDGLWFLDSRLLFWLFALSWLLQRRAAR